MPKTEQLIGDDATPDVEAAPPPSDADMATLRDLARQQYRLIKEVADLQDKLNQKTEELRRNVENDLPTKMQELGFTTFGLVGGFEIKTRDVVNASINDERREAAHAWLEKNHHGGLIKHRFEVFFNRDDEAWARKFMADCARRKRPLDLRRKDWVEPQTLLAFVREQLRTARAEGRNPEELAPAKLLGVFERKIAVVTGPDVPKLKKAKR